MTAADTLVGFVSVAAIGALVYGPWQATCTDIARQYCFAKRDRLFDLALAGRIDFRSNEYRAMRLSLEKTIRFCHEISIYRLLLLGLDRTSREGSIHLSTLSKAASRVEDAETRKELEALAHGVEDMILLVIWMRSPLLWALTVPFLVLGTTAAAFSATRRAMLALLRALGERAQIQAEGA